MYNGYLTNGIIKKIGRCYSLLFKVHALLRMPVLKSQINAYQDTINTLLVLMRSKCKPSSKKKCNSMKRHYPYHWGDTRKDIGCPALEKSLNASYQSPRNDIMLLQTRKIIVTCKWYTCLFSLPLQFNDDSVNVTLWH
jgi:hypothetical protein